MHIKSYSTFLHGKTHVLLYPWDTLSSWNDSPYLKTASILSPIYIPSQVNIEIYHLTVLGGQRGRG